jgi:hypothetical protein
MPAPLTIVVKSVPCGQSTRPIMLRQSAKVQVGELSLFYSAKVMFLSTSGRDINPPMTERNVALSDSWRAASHPNTRPNDCGQHLAPRLNGAGGTKARSRVGLGQRTQLRRSARAAPTVIVLTASASADQARRIDVGNGDGPRVCTGEADSPHPLVTFWSQTW